MLFCNVNSLCMFKNKHDISSCVSAYQGLLLFLFKPHALFVQCWNVSFPFSFINALISLNNLFEQLKYKYFKYVF